MEQAISGSEKKMVNMNSIKAIFFDMDGTLVEIIPCEAIAKYSEFVKSFDPDIDDFAIKRAYIAARTRLKKIEHALCGREKYVELWRLCFEQLGVKGDKHILASELQTRIESECDRLYSDVTKTLRVLHSKNIFLGILSDRAKIAIEKSLNRHRISKFFNAFISASELDPTRGKLNTAVWRRLIGITGVPPYNILYVGDDYLRDVRPAIKHNVNAILVDRKKAHANVRHNCAVIEHLEDLISVLEALR